MNILDIIFPKRCPFCDGVIPPGWQICDDCTGKAELVTEPVCKRCGKPIENSRREYCGDCERKKHFYDEEENMYVIFTRMDLEAKLHVGKSAISSAFEQLNKANLIREKRQGKNKPNRIYVGKTISEIKEEFINVKSENQTSGSPFFNCPEVRKSDTNKNRLNSKNKYNTFYNYEGRDYSDMDWSKLYANNNWN